MTEMEAARGSANAWGPLRLDDGAVKFRLWAPGLKSLALRANGTDRAMQPAGDGWFEIIADDIEPGDAYGFVLPDGMAVPDPASRRQQSDVHGPSLLTDPESYSWRTQWRGRPWAEAVICELHIGAFTQAGTFEAAIEKFGHLAGAGITAIELLPVAQFGGSRGWGYDGVLPFAPHTAYGSHDAMKAMIDAAHAHGLMVLLDVVYNHFGPDGNYIGQYAPRFFDRQRQTPWGAGIDYTRTPVRQFFIENALYWLSEFRLDGLRLDAIDQVRDPSETELLMEIAQVVRSRITDRPIHLTTEDNRNITVLHERGSDGSTPLYTAEWNDDFHNAVHVIATGEGEGYYADFSEEPWLLLAQSLAEGFGFQGQPSPQTGQSRGNPSGHLPPLAFIDFLQNHDQIGNRAFGERLKSLTDPATLGVLTSILLLSPHVPMLFMGEEYGEENPFCFFADFDGDLGRAVTEGRRQEFAGFAGFRNAQTSEVPDPVALATFEMSKLDWSRCAGTEGQETLKTMRALLTKRREYLTPHLGGSGANTGKIAAHKDGGIAVDWSLEGASWHLRANLSDRELMLPRAPGRMIHRTGDGPHAPKSSCHYLQIQAS